MIRKDHVFKTLMLSRKGTVDKPAEINDPLRFAGDGITFRAKLIGVLEVSSPRGDRLCQEALAELKMAIKAAGEHKQRILICVALDGLRLRDERTGDCLYHHAVHKISFIAQDITDPRAFGYIFGSPDQGHRFYGIKTDKPANLVVMAMRDLFQVVYDLKKKDLDRVKQFTPSESAKSNGASHHFTDSMDSLDKMLAISSHFAGRSSTPPIQTADLLNLSSEERSPLKETSLKKDPSVQKESLASASTSFDPFDDVADPFAQVPFHKTLATLPPPKSKSTKATFPEKFTDSFVHSPCLPPPPKSPNLKTTTRGTQNSTQNTAPTTHRDNYATVRPRKKSGDASLPPPLAKSPATKKLSGDKLTTWSASAIPRPSSVSSSNASPLPTMSIVDPFDSQPFPVNFPATAESGFTAGISSSPATVDVFADLDPLGTGKIKPYVDRKDFFQDLRKMTPPKKSQIAESVETATTLPSAAADPFGSLNQVAAAPEPDPFDTHFADFKNPPFFTTSADPPLTSAGFSASFSSSHSSNFSSFDAAFPSSASAAVFTTPAPAIPPPLRVTLPLTHSDSDSEVSALTSRRRKPSPQVQPQIQLRLEPKREVEKNSSSDAESSSSDEHSDHEASAKAPEPPPRPLVLKPPPLPPKGQPPVVPQRPGVSPPPPAESSGLRTPPLPVPSRKQKPGASTITKASREEEPKKAANLNQISLLQLSSMSLSELADTLRLPPARLACMTLTELALRLAELNKELETKVEEEEKANECEEEEEEEEEEEAEEEANKEEDKMEICFKGGKLYEILSDAHEDDEEEENDDKDEEEEEEKIIEAAKDNANLANQTAEDKYAALREIMELELKSRPTSVLKEETESGFANFDSMEKETEKVAENFQQSLGFDDDFGAENPQDSFVASAVEAADEFADKFAAFEARFPENPVEGFADGFADSFANFQPEVQAEENKVAENSQNLQVSPNVKKSQSVNIFKAVEDPFDDDFFQETESEPVCKPSSKPDPVKSRPELSKMATIVEDPFAWVQPFDDNFKFDDEFDA